MSDTAGSVDVGLQTDLNEPDIYYFAGGRHVGSLTESLEEYPLLTLFEVGSSARIIVLESSDSDTETSINDCDRPKDEKMNKAVEVESNSNNNNNKTTVGNEENVPKDKEIVIMNTSDEKTSSSETGTGDEQITAKEANNKNTLDQNISSDERPVTPIETKSSATQLSAGALLNSGTPKKKEYVDASTSPIIIPKLQEIRHKSTFAEKTKSGLLKKTSPVIEANKTNNSNAPSVGQRRPNSVTATTATKTKTTPFPNYRSNIASRCRTAVNTGQSLPQELNQKLKRSSAPVTPTHSNGAGDVSNNMNDAFKHSDLNISGSGDDKNKHISNNNHTTQRVNCNALSNNPLSASSVAASDSSGKKSQWKVPGNPQNTIANKQVGILRSKSMINPVSTKSQRGPAVKSTIPSANVRKNPIPQISSVGSLSDHTHSNSYFSLPDETSYRRKSNIDEDGWETVKARSNRSKWSSSNSSLASSNANQSRNSLDKGSSSKLQSTPETIPKENVKPQNKLEKNKDQSNVSKLVGIKNKKNQPAKSSSNEQSTKENKHKESTQPTKTDKESNLIRAKESVDDEIESSMDEEEITKKEADLDDAIREEEMLEEELLQVEKDFERIEKNNTVENDGIAIDIENENSVSPGIPDEDEELTAEDSYFFVSMNGSETIKKGDASVAPLFPDTRNSPAKEIDKGETLRRYEAKLAKAERNRERLLQIKFNQFVELSDRLKALNQTTRKLVSERDELIARSVNRRKQAYEKRKMHLKNIQRKAHDEDSKAKEIAFINLLEAQNKRHDYFQSAQEIEDRLQGMREDRRLKLEARASKVTTVIQRQEAIKQDWQQKLEQLQEKRKRTEERIQREKEERARERTEIAQEKARDREVRISALAAAKQAEKEELQKKIKQKQEDSARRHEENIEQIRQKAIELGSFRGADDSATSSVRVCTLCKVMLQSEIHEMQHVRGRAHLDAVKKADKSCASPAAAATHPEPVSNEAFGLKYIVDIQTDKMDPSMVHSDKSRFKSVKKHVKKLFQKLVEAGKTFEKLENDYRAAQKPRGDPNVKSKIKKNILELDRLVGTFDNNKGTPNLATQMDRLMSEIRRAAMKNDYIQENIFSWNALNVALKVIQCQATDLPIRCKINACDMMHGFVATSLANGMYIVRGTGICTIMQICSERWHNLIPDDNRWLVTSPSGGAETLPTDPLIESLMRLLFQLLEYVANPFSGILSIANQLKSGELEDIKKRTHDIIGYLVTSGVIDRISVYCGGVRGPVDDCPAVAGLLRIFLDFLTLLIYILQLCWGEDARGCIIDKKEQDSTQLVAALESSELAGAVSMTYSLLIHHGAPCRSRQGEVTGDSPRAKTPPPPGNNTAEVIKSTLCLINAMARLDLFALQNVLGSETMSLQFRHIASQLLWLIVPHRTDYTMKRILTELIIAIGNFTVGNKSNQVTIQSGQTPTVLQLLCDLPEEYFTTKQLQHNFFPTLLAATYGCPENQEVLVQKNIKMEILENYMNSDAGKENVIMKRLHRMATMNNSIPTAKPKSTKKKK